MASLFTASFYFYWIIYIGLILLSVIYSCDIVFPTVDGCAAAVEIDVTCAAYRPVAKRGSILFFVMSSLSTLNNMYELSLALYMVVFLQSLERAEADSMIENRLENILDQQTKDCYNYCCRGIFETHKLMFSLQMTLRIQDGEGRLDMQLVDFFPSSRATSRSTRAITRRRRPTASTSSPTRDGTTCSGSSRSPTTSPT